MFQSRGSLVAERKSADVTLWEGRTDQWPSSLDLGFRWASYASIYKSNNWVRNAVDKHAFSVARLPLKTYERGKDGRPEATGPYADLIRRPSSMFNPFAFMFWTVQVKNIFGEVYWGKRRDRGGRPVELIPLHPAFVKDETLPDGSVRWSYDNGRTRIESIDRRDLVQFVLAPDPDNPRRGLSPLESLKSTLQNEEGAQRANSAMWQHGALPRVVLKHPRNLSDGASKRLRANWSEIHEGVDNWARTAILEEGLDLTVLPVDNSALEYSAGRQFNREAVGAAYDLSPIALHDFTRATFANVVESLRSLYRDSVAGRLKLLEAGIEFDLRDGRFGSSGDPDFGEGQYAEFLLDEVLRGDFETRTDAYQKGIQSGWLTPAEVRQMENRPFIPGSDVLLANSTLRPVNVLAETPVGPMPGGAAQTAADAPSAPSPPLSEGALRTLMGRLSRQKTLAEVDPGHLVAGLNGDTGTVLRALAAAHDEHDEIHEFRDRLRALGG